MTWNVKEQKETMANITNAQHHQMLYLQMQVTLQMLHLPTNVICNETFVMHKCFKCKSKSRVQCVDLNYVPIKPLEIQTELLTEFYMATDIQDLQLVVER